MDAKTDAGNSVHRTNSIRSAALDLASTAMRTAWTLELYDAHVFNQAMPAAPTSAVNYSASDAHTQPHRPCLMPVHLLNWTTRQ